MKALMRQEPFHRKRRERPYDPREYSIIVVRSIYTQIPETLLQCIKCHQLKDTAELDAINLLRSLLLMLQPIIMRALSCRDACRGALVRVVALVIIKTGNGARKNDLGRSFPSRYVSK
jgi:hypothetical protein